MLEVLRNSEHLDSEVCQTIPLKGHPTGQMIIKIMLLFWKHTRFKSETEYE